MTYPYLDLTKAVGWRGLNAHWQLDESSGTSVADSSGNGCTGTSSNVTWAQTGIGDGKTAAGFNGTSSKIAVFSTTLRDLMNANAGTILAWIKPSSTTWAAATDFCVFRFRFQATNYIEIVIDAANTLHFAHSIGGVETSIDVTESRVDWFPVVITWDIAADELKAYVAGVHKDTATGLDPWLFDLHDANIGVIYSGASFFLGDIAHVAVWDVALAEDEVEALSLTGLITPITDRDLADLAARNSKSFFNVVDWARINANSIIAREHLIAWYGALGRDDLTMPEDGDFPSAEDIYDLGYNIYRLSDGLVPDYDKDEMQYIFQEGGAAFAPDYQTFNVWEGQLEQLFGPYVIYFITWTTSGDDGIVSEIGEAIIA